MIIIGVLIAFLFILSVIYVWSLDNTQPPPPPSKIARGDNTFPLIGPLRNIFEGN